MNRIGKRQTPKGNETLQTFDEDVEEQQKNSHEDKKIRLPKTMNHGNILLKIFLFSITIYALTNSLQNEIATTIEPGLKPTVAKEVVVEKQQQQDQQQQQQQQHQQMKFLPLVLFFEGGCSGSTAIGRFFEKMIDAHGLSRYQNRVGFEFMDIGKKHKNHFYHDLVNTIDYINATKEEILLDSIELAKKEADSLNQLFYFKAHPLMLHGEYRERLDRIGLAYAGVFRLNVLDRCICITNDCFRNAAGYPVYKHNNVKAGICFDRRKKDNDLPVWTYFEKPTECLETSYNHQTLIRTQDFPAVAEEELFLFEYTDTDEAWDISVMAWMRLLRPLLFGFLDEEIVKEVLKEYRGKRPVPLPHRDLVANYDHLLQEIKGTQWMDYLRTEYLS